MMRKLFKRDKAKHSRTSTSENDLPTLLVLGEYEYEPLPGLGWTRLCTLLPGQGHEPIRCSVTLHFLDAASTNRYNALSYTWDSPDKVIDVECDGKRLSITRALDSALLRLRDRRKSRKIWIDAICIDQSQTAPALSERAQQVQMMHRIFSTADEVVIDLGEGSEESDRALRLMNAIRKAFEARGRRPAGEISMKEFGIPEWDDSQWLDLLAFMTRRWFSRIWVVQEYALARKVHIMVGTKVLDNIALNMACTFLVTNLPRLQLHLLDDPQHMQLQRSALKGIGMYGLMNIHRDAVQNKKTTTLAELVYSSRIFDATDQRDKVYGVLGLASERENVTVDYQISEVEVFKRTAVCVIESGHVDTVLVMAGGLSSLQDAPSWVPNYSQQKSRGVFVPSRQDTDPCFQAGLELKANPTIKFDGAYLEVNGILVDEVTHLTEVWEMGNEYDWETFYGNGGSLDYIMRLAEWLESARRLVEASSLADCTLAYKELPDSFWITLVGGAYDETHDIAEDSTFSSVVSEFAEMCDVLQRIQQEPMTLSRVSELASFTSILQKPGLTKYIGQMTAQLPDKKLCCTRAGRFGLVPPLTQEGDVVAVIGGMEMPFILHSRPTPDSYAADSSVDSERDSLQYQFLGSCYIHSIMKGEAVRDLRIDTNFSRLSLV